MEKLELDISAVAFGGNGIARLEGKVYFVSDTIEGDRVLAEVSQDRGRYAEAKVISYLKKSQFRGPVTCQFFDQCGGCQWLGVNYEKQLEWKKNFIFSALHRLGKVTSDKEIQISGSPAVLGYRNRIFLRGRITDEGSICLGYFRQGSRDLVPINNCQIASPAINDFLGKFCSLKSPRAVKPQKIRIELQEIRPIKEGDNSRLFVTVFPEDEKTSDLNELILLICEEFKEVAWAGLALSTKNGPILPFDKEEGLIFYTSPGVFQQINFDHNRNLRAHLKSLVSSINPTRILDVFAGSGNLSLLFADGSRYLEGVESNNNSVNIGQFNIKENTLINVNWLSGEAEAHLWKVAKNGEKFDLVILDPPRQGMYQGMIPLAKIAPQHIIYVSCDPATLARDIGALGKKGYKINSITAFDFFPNTYHVESVVFLKKDT